METSDADLTQLPKELGQVKATDNDLSENGRISYSIKTQGVEGLFRIDENGSLLLIGRLDREVRGHYVLSIMAVDHGTPPRYVSVIVF